MMLRMSPEDISQVQRGMAARPDSVATLETINVPTLIVAGDEDTLTPVADAEVIRAEYFREPTEGNPEGWPLCCFRATGGSGQGTSPVPRFGARRIA